MDAVTMIKGRRSIRKFTDEKVSREIMDDIISSASYSPTWAHFQIIRYYIIEDTQLKAEIADKAVGFEGNAKVIKESAGVAVVSYVTGKSGHSPQGDIVTSKGETWAMFDAGAACQTFCLAAHEKGVGTVIQGIFDEKEVAKVINLPDDEIVAALIPYGYAKSTPNTPKRKELSDIVRFK